MIAKRLEVMARVARGMASEVDGDALRLLREAVRGFLERHRPATGAVPQPAEVGRLWRQAAELGWTCLGRPGSQAGIRAAVVVVEETGRAACPLPVLGSVCALAAAATAPPEVAALVAERLTAGEAVAVALGEAGGETGGGAVQLRDTASGLALEGRIRYVEGLPPASLVLLAASPGPIFALVDAGAVGITPTPGLAVPALADVEVATTPTAVWEVSGEVLADVVRRGRLVCTARALGAAQRAFDLAVEHAKTRQQFGSPIGRFQAVQHRLADAATLLDGCRLLVERAAAECDRAAPLWRSTAAAACAFAAPALRRVAREAQHTLAGVGYIEEHEAPRHFRRVHADSLRFGGAPAARSELVAAVVDGLVDDCGGAS